MSTTKKIEEVESLASTERIQKLIDEADNELIKIQPEIDYLEQCQKKLKELKEQQFKLSALKMSLKSLIKTSDININITQENNISYANKNIILDDINVDNTDINNNKIRKIFLPDKAISEVKNYLRTKNNLNYEIFKAIVFNSGSAVTKEIKQYLIENKIKQPKTGKTFEDVELKEISSRVNYLVRKNILTSPEPGVFRSVFGWSDIE